MDSLAKQSTKGQCALALAGRGFRVFPLHDNGKTPRIKDWQRQATTDRGAIESWWTRWPGANVGIHGRGLLIIDADTKDGKRGLDSLLALQLDHGIPLRTFTVTTPSGGTHRYLRTPRPVPNSAGKLGEGIDIRGEDGYVVGPGSTIDDRPYQLSDDTPPADAPETLVVDCGQRREKTTEAPADVDTDRARRRAMEWLQNHAPLAVEGDGGDQTTYEVAAKMKDYGCDEGTALELLAEHWNDRCSPPWDPRDLQTKVHNAYRYGQNALGALAPEAEFPPVDSAMEKDGGPIGLIDIRDHMGTARQFVKARYSRDKARTLHYGGGEFCAWSGTHYADLAPRDLKGEIYDFLDRSVKRVESKDGAAAQVPVQPNQKLVGEVLSALEAVTKSPQVTTAPCWLTDEGRPAVSAHEIVPVRNGLLHLPTLRLHPHTPALFARHSLGFDYEADAPAPAHWLKFLDSLWPDDTDNRRALQEIMGYLISGETAQQKIFMFVGPKRSGKGTIGRIITALLGHDFVAGPRLGALTSHFGLAQLIGKTAAIIADCRIGSRADQSSIAEILLNISGEDLQTVDRKHRESWSGRLPVRFLILTNEVPRIADSSGALASRFIILPMDHSFYGREDHGLEARLMAELPGIFLWCLDGWKRLRGRGHFVQPGSGQNLLEELEDLSSPVRPFVSERCETGAGHEVECDVLYVQWNMWCTRHGRQPGTAQSFGRDLRAAVSGVATRQVRIGGTRKKVFTGIRLIPGFD